MKILVVCQHYWPEPYPLPDICEELVRRGHTVDVITDVPNYPMGRIYPEYKRGQRRKETHNGVQITRVFTIPRRHNALFRLLNYYSYAISSTLYIKRLTQDYDVVFANQTSPVMMSTAAFAYAKKHEKRVVLYCMDLWPASLAAGGIKEHSLIYKFFDLQSKRLYQKADKILITSQMFQQYLMEKHGIPKKRISYLPQYAPTQFVKGRITTGKKETVDLMFAGNIGTAQNIQTILGAAELLKTVPNLRWHIIGDGSELAHMQALAKEKNLNNVLFYGRKPAEQMPQYYAIADAMLVTLMADDFISLTLPGKVQTYMAAGKPILAAANGEISRVISAAQCGYCAAAEDAMGLAAIVMQFLQHSDRQLLGENAKMYYEKYFECAGFMKALEHQLKEQIGVEPAQNMVSV